MRPNIREGGGPRQVLACMAFHNFTNVTFTSSGVGTFEGRGQVGTAFVVTILTRCATIRC